MRELKIGTSSVRGVVGEALTPELIVYFASALGTWAGGYPVVMCRDPRKSSTMLRAAAIAGLLATGSAIIDAGICPTPFVSFLVRELGAGAGLSITGSHNDFRWNALKFIGDDGALLNAVKSEELLDIYHASAFATRPGARAALTTLARGTEPVAAHLPSYQALSERYLEHLLAGLDVHAVRARKFRVALDFCNGSAGDLVIRLLERLGCKVFPINEMPAGRFAHAPAPTPKNMRELSSLVRHLDVDLGAAVNVDGDRLALVLPDGTCLSEEYTLPLAAQGRLRRRPGVVVTNLSTSRMIDVVAAECSQIVQRAAVGEGHVIDRAIEEGAVVAGEGSGGVGMLPSTLAFDAGLTCASVLESLALADRSLGTLVDALPRFSNRKGELSSSPDAVYRVLQQFRAFFSDRKPDVSDGLRVEWPDAWLHVRASNTEPLLRIIVEAETETRADALFDEAMEHGRRATRESREGAA